MKKLLILFLFAVPALAQSPYSLPNNNAGCPASCRQIPWQAGSDLWNSGALPTYTGVACSGLHNNGSTDDGPGIQACLNALSTNQCAVIPSGTNYYVNSTVRVPSHTCLRGNQAEGSPPYLPSAQSGETRIIMGSNSTIQVGNVSWGITLNPGTSYGQGSLPSTFSLSGSPQKGDTTLTIGSGSVSVGTWIVVYGNDDPATVSNTGQDGFCPWCGANDGSYIRSQIVQVTAINSGSGGAGSNVSISRPLYYPLYTSSVSVPCPNGGMGCTEPAGAKYTIINFNVTEAGIENIRFDGSQHDMGPNRIILLQACLFCWVKNVETYVTGSNSLSAHVETDASYGAEIRDSAFHDQRSGASGSGYGIYFQWINSDHKVENNVVYHSRHGLINQGGDSGTVWLYNFVDDLYTDDGSYLGSTRAVHGGQSVFNLYEGNIISHYVGDDISGSAQHHVLFRNWLWGGETNTNWPSGNLGSFSYPLGGFPPSDGYVGVDLYPCNIYYSVVNNVIGSNALSSGGYWPTWGSATYSGFNEFASKSNPYVYSLAPSTTSYCPSPMPTPAATIITQGNYNYFNGVPAGEGTTSTYANSLYYSSEPSFISSVGAPWPQQGSDLTPKGNVQQPALCRALGTSCAAGPPSANPPTFSPASPYTGPATTVTIASSTPSSTITYCTDTVNTCTPSTVGTSVSFSSTGYIRAFATASGFTQSSTSSWQGTLSTPTLTAPTFSPSGATSTSAGYFLGSSATVTITCPSGATCGFTTDGSTPTASGGTVTHGTIYSSPFSLSITTGGTQLQAIASQSGFTNSSVTSQTYYQRSVVLDGSTAFNGGAASASNFNTTLFTPLGGDGMACEVTLGSNVTITSVSDPANGAYSVASVTPYDANSASLSAIYYKSSVANTPIQITVQLSAPSVFNGIACQAFTPSVAGTFTLDPNFNQAANPFNNSGATPSANPNIGTAITPSGSNRLIIGGMANASYPSIAPTAGTGFTFTPNQLTGENYFPEYQVQTSATATNLPYVQASDLWLAHGAAFYFVPPTLTAPVITSGLTVTTGQVHTP